MPTALDGLNADSMNYASVVFVGFAVIAFLYYVIHAKNTFNGPPASNHEEDSQEVNIDSKL